MCNQTDLVDTTCNDTNGMNMEIPKGPLATSSRRRARVPSESPSSSDHSSSTNINDDEKYSPKHNDSPFQRKYRHRRIAFACLLMAGVAVAGLSHASTKVVTNAHPQVRRETLEVQPTRTRTVGRPTTVLMDEYIPVAKTAKEGSAKKPEVKASPAATKESPKKPAVEATKPIQTPKEKESAAATTAIKVAPAVKIAKGAPPMKKKSSNPYLKIVAPKKEPVKKEAPKKTDATISSTKKKLSTQSTVAASPKKKESATTSRKPANSNFDSKPRMVGLVDPRVGSPKEVRDQLLSKPRTVIQINPESFEVIPTAASRKLNQTQPLWNWFVSWAEPMSDVDNPGGIIKPDRKTIDKDPCQLSHEWMTKSFPTCNNLHDQSMMGQLIDPDRLQPKFLMGEGSMRSVWALEQTLDRNSPIETLVLKTLKYDRSFDDDNLDRHRRDALISERLSGSPHFLNIYGYCGQSAVYQYAASGSLYDAIGAREYRDEKNDAVAHAKWAKWTSQRKLEVAYDVVSAVADLHDIDHDGRPSVAHDDLDVTQFVSVDGGKSFKLSDFNGSPFLKWHREWNETCPFRALMKGGKTRSPEEYNGDWVTEKLDIYAMGNVLYTILVGEYPFRELGTDVTESRVMDGVLPQIPDHIRQDKNPLNQALLGAIKLCLKKDPNERASARYVQNYLKGYLDQPKQQKSKTHTGAKQEKSKVGQATPTQEKPRLGQAKPLKSTAEKPRKEEKPKPMKSKTAVNLEKPEQEKAKPLKSKTGTVNLEQLKLQKPAKQEMKEQQKPKQDSKKTGVYKGPVNLAKKEKRKAIVYKGPINLPPAKTSK